MDATHTKSVQSVNLRISGDDDFDEDVTKAQPHTWFGRRVNQLVRTYLDVGHDTSLDSLPDQSDSEDVMTNDEDEGQGPSNIKSNGFAEVTPKGYRSRLKIHRKYIMLLTWVLLVLNLLLISGVMAVFLMVKLTPMEKTTFEWKMALLPLHMNVHYDRNKCEMNSKGITMAKICSQFYVEQFCPFSPGVSRLFLFVCIPSFCLYVFVGPIFLLLKRSRSYLKTLISALSSLIVYICLFYLIFAGVMYARALRQVENFMMEEMFVEHPMISTFNLTNHKEKLAMVPHQRSQNWILHDDSNLVHGNVTFFWENTQTQGKCCGIHGPQDWIPKSTNQNLSRTDVPHFPLSCCDPSKSECRDLPNLSQVYETGCLTVEKQIIHQYTSSTIVCMILAAITSPVMKFLFYFIGRISKKYIGRKCMNLRTPFMKFQAYGNLEMKMMNLSPNDCELIMFGQNIKFGDVIKARVNRKRILKLIVKRRRRRIAKIMVRCARIRKNVVYKVASNREMGIIILKF